MYIVYVKNYKRKLFIFGAIVLFWVIMLLLSSLLLNNSLVFNVTIDNYLTFSYPMDFEVDNIFVNPQVAETSIQTNSTFKKPVARDFSTYNSPKGKFSFNYPSMFTLSQQDFEGSDILYHVDFKSKTQDSRGFVQVWNMPYSLKEFLDSSKKTSQLSYKYFTQKPVTVNSLPGYLWDYSVLGNDGKYYKGMEAYFKKTDRMYRISYFVPENAWNKAQSDTFWNIVNSFKTY